MSEGNKEKVKRILAEYQENLNKIEEGNKQNYDFQVKAIANGFFFRLRDIGARSEIIRHIKDYKFYTLAKKENGELLPEKHAIALSYIVFHAVNAYGIKSVFEHLFPEENFLTTLKKLNPIYWVRRLFGLEKNTDTLSSSKRLFRMLEEFKKTERSINGIEEKGISFNTFKNIVTEIEKHSLNKPTRAVSEGDFTTFDSQEEAPLLSVGDESDVKNQDFPQFPAALMTRAPIIDLMSQYNSDEPLMTFPQEEVLIYLGDESDVKNQDFPQFQAALMTKGPIIDLMSQDNPDEPLMTFPQEEEVLVYLGDESDVKNQDFPQFPAALMTRGPIIDLMSQDNPDEPFIKFDQNTESQVLQVSKPLQPVAYFPSTSLAPPPPPPPPPPPSSTSSPTLVSPPRKLTEVAQKKASAASISVALASNSMFAKIKAKAEAENNGETVGEVTTVTANAKPTVSMDEPEVSVKAKGTATSDKKAAGKTNSQFLERTNSSHTDSDLSGGELAQKLSERLNAMLPDDESEDDDKSDHGWSDEDDDNIIPALPTSSRPPIP